MAVLRELPGASDDFARELGELVPFIDLPVGPWTPGTGAPFGEAIAVLVVRGLLLLDLQLDRGGATELLGPGDLFRTGPSPDELLPSATAFLVAEPARIAVLDQRLSEVLARWPDVGARLVAGSALRHRRQSLQRTASQLPRVEERLLAMLWLLAERWGHVGPEGVIVPMALTHELLGRLVGARRPTVTMAIGQLVEAGHLRRRSDRGFALAPASRRLLAPHGDRGASGVADLTLVDAGEGIPMAAPARPRPVPVATTAREDAETAHTRAVSTAADQRLAIERAVQAVERSRRLVEETRARRAARVEN